MKKFLDNIGVGILWNKVKNLLRLKADKVDIEPILITEISFYELLKYSEDKDNYKFTEITPELISSIYNKVNDSLHEFKRLLIPYAPISVDIVNSYLELDKVIVENEAALSVIINNFVYSIYINVDTNEIKVKKLNNTNINLTNIKEILNELSRICSVNEGDMIEVYEGLAFDGLRNVEDGQILTDEFVNELSYISQRETKCFYLNDKFYIKNNNDVTNVSSILSSEEVNNILNKLETSKYNQVVIFMEEDGMKLGLIFKNKTKVNKSEISIL